MSDDTEHSTRGWIALGVTVLLAIGAVGLAITRDDGPAGDRLWGNTTRASPTGVWTRIADAPLSPRSNALLAWTGTEVLVIGGDTTPPCPPNANCIPDPEQRPPLDGAAYDPAAATWRTIADPPVPLAWGPTTAVVDGVLYIQRPDDHDHLLRYDVAGDQWSELPAPPAMAARTLVADEHRLLAPLQLTKGLGDDAVDLAFDPATGEWTELPIDPIRDAEARQVQAVDGRLYLIAGSLDPDADGMSAIVHAAVLEGSTWRRLPDPDTDGYLPSLAADELIVSPQDDETAGDGDDVPGWWGLDTTTDEWVDVPEIPSAPGPFVAAAWSAGDDQIFSGNVVLDARTRTWAPLGAPDLLERQGSQSTAMGDRLLVFGGALLDGEGFDAYQAAEQQNDAWVWTPT